MSAGKTPNRSLQHPSSLTLVVETPQGELVRRVPDASPLPTTEIQGYAAEDATRDAAMSWAMPDFVFRSEQQPTGSGVRELGDGLVLVGDQALVLQVKSRTKPTGDPAEEAAWLGKHITKAIRQAKGTVRRFGLQPATLTNARGLVVPVEAADHSWLKVVVVDHPDPPPGFTPPSEPDLVVLLRRDWEFLFDHLRSARAVAAYLNRVAGDPLELGNEPVRYHEYALADLGAAPDSLSEQLASLGDTLVSTARAPLHAATAEDTPAHMLLRIIMEDVATTPYPYDVGAADQLRLLADIDGLPVEARTELGHTLLGFMRDLANWKGEGTLTHSRIVIPNPGDFVPLVFMVASEMSELADNALFFRTQLLHHDYHQVVGNPNGRTIGILLAPSGHPNRLWDTTLKAAHGDQGHSPKDIAVMRRIINQATV